MNRYGTYIHAYDDDGLEGPDVVHSPDFHTGGGQTLCGHVDRMDIVWHDTKKKLSCKNCRAIINFVHEVFPHGA